MDKNTISGLILMAVVFFAFMWLSPKKEKIDTTSSDPSATEQTAQNSFSPLSDQELSWLRNNLAANGESSVDAEGVRCYNHSDANMSLSLKGDSLYGTVNVNGSTYALSDIIDPSSSAVDQNARREAVELLRNTSTSMGKFGKFSKFLAGQDTKVKMENDVLALELSAKSGSITRAELKKYDTEYSADESKKVKNKVVIFEGDKNSFNFQLPLPQAINTSDLYFTPRQLNDSTVLMALELAPEAYWGIEYTLPKHDSYLVKMRIVQKNMPQYI
ncbi:MAG: YidC/Oxa1 family insertase periplasmic-domain containing protein, partial [Muribaculaceae bacterium]|nr:YidC/Oxa1 family insertase periplasmic-domain containing protein [Muribaculaceae bacterium]